MVITYKVVHCNAIDTISIKKKIPAKDANQPHATSCFPHLICKIPALFLMAILQLNCNPIQNKNLKYSCISAHDQLLNSKESALTVMTQSNSIFHKQTFKSLKQDPQNPSSLFRRWRHKPIL